MFLKDRSPLALIAGALPYLLGLGLLLSPKIFAKNLYTIADLEVLRDGKSYKEFFEHAKDVIPTKRDSHWRDMLSNMASDYVDQQRSSKRFTRSAFKNVEEIANWPEQKRDEFFQVKRQAYAVDYFKACLTLQTGDSLPPTKAECSHLMDKFWKSSIQDVETAYQLLLLVEGFFPQKNAWSYLKPIVSSELSNFYCNRPVVQSSLFRYLTELDLKDQNEKALNLKLEQTAHKSCWKHILPELKSVLSELPPKEGFPLFKIASSMEVLSSIEKDTWLIRYYLDSPEAGDTLNHAWHTLGSLSQNYDQRIKVLRGLISLDPLPGEVFGLKDKKRRITLSRYFYDNFPEYVQNYAEICMSYLAGEKPFPTGNPTKECHELMKLVEIPEAKMKLSDQVKLKYSAIQRKVNR